MGGGEGRERERERKVWGGGEGVNSGGRRGRAGGRDLKVTAFVPGTQAGLRKRRASQLLSPAILLIRMLRHLSSSQEIRVTLI
jgi:hypothetical protein